MVIYLGLTKQASVETNNFDLIMKLRKRNLMTSILTSPKNKLRTNITIEPGGLGSHDQRRYKTKHIF